MARRKKVVEEPVEEQVKTAEEALDDSNSIQFQVGLTQTGHVRVMMAGPSEDCQDGWGYLQLDLSDEEAQSVFDSLKGLIPLSGKLREKDGVVWIQTEGSA